MNEIQTRVQLRYARISGLLLLCAGFCLTAAAYETSSLIESSFPRESALKGKDWIHGSMDCTSNSDAAIDVYRHDRATYIFRQNMCLSFEAPFIFVLVGETRVLVLDTGDTEEPSDFPLYQTVKSVLGQEAMATKEILVIHSHSHGDHYRGDIQFKGIPKITVVNPTEDNVRNFFGFSEWPSKHVTLELGGRGLIVIPTPGHQEEAITIYDPRTKWLLTGDTLYPGYIYVKDWDDYKASIARLASFSGFRDVSAILGSHIEMTDKPGQYYPIGTTFQPDEAALDLAPDDLHELNTALQESGDPQELVFDNFIIAPMNFLQKSLSNLARWMTQ